MYSYTREWLISRLRFYQGFGFFEEYSGLSDEDLADQIICIRQEETNESASHLFNEGYDWLILDLDKKRVLSAAADILYAEEPPDYSFEVFVETIHRISSISRGSFNPQNIRESEPEKIEFLLNGKVVSFVPEGPPDDPLILASQINSMLVETGYQFRQWDLYPDINLVVMTEDEANRIGWKFLPDWWMFER